MLIAGLLLITLAIIGMRMWRSSSSGSAQSIAASPVAEPARSLIYSIVVQKYRNGKPFQDPFKLGGEINFEKDYRVRLNLRSPQDGYL
ncbi:MAG: hypothetical protein ABR568_24170, partial [Pyrinomonadaceae bacterium]